MDTHPPKGGGKRVWPDKRSSWSTELVDDAFVGVCPIRLAKPPRSASRSMFGLVCPFHRLGVSRWAVDLPTSKHSIMPA